jgi:hypothetical protein
MSDPQKGTNDDLNRFGEMVEALNAALGTNQTEVARRCHIGKNTLSVATRNPNGPSKEIVPLLASVYQVLSNEKHIVLPVGWERLFFMTLYETHLIEVFPVVSEVDQAIANLRNWADVARERNELRRQVELLTKRKQLGKEVLVLQRENEELRREIQRLRGETEDS